PPLQAGIGFLQLFVEQHVVERDRQPAAEDLDQRAVGLRKVARRFQHHHHFASADRADIEHRAAVGEFVMPAQVTLSSEAIWVSTPSASRCMDLTSNSVPAASMMISSPRRVSTMR